ncbi:LOW QUALITY PROTEIN: serine protease snake-like [Lucilia sericata]|uniref:LOW QUALITY PROTEIN: serine protease snake-like n=1 Tax=Lucilia sericata TaxID=13632 RepID=UPI0018A82516|nr:LOW QUALITY PROTEIN: serine protease snake-like [Lucilia sericata]XP_037826760.1 LOW QUALITY PROTEIN: serine protease snake-like [Lucilia sericata]
MFKTSIILLIFGTLITKHSFFTNANECALNTECVHIRDCPRVLNNFHLIRNKPYCSLNQKGTHVCCLKPPEKYTQEKDEDIRSVRECKSVQRYRKSCEKTLIVSGQKAEAQEFPFMALLFYKHEDTVNYLCGGTLISNKYVLTAAHCFFVYSPPNWVRLGELDYSTTTDDASPIDYEIKNIITHPQLYHRHTRKYNDIALVELVKEVQFNDYIMPACLPLVDGRDFQEYLAAGWGRPNDTTLEMSPHLLKVKLDRFDDDTCISKVEQTEELKYGVNKRTQMCAGSFTDKRDTCMGDSGGPLFVDHPDYKCLFLVLGITSFSHGGCGNVGHPAVYTRIQLYLDWIEQIVWKEAAKLSK